MEDAGRLAEHLEHIEIAVGIEGIAGVVGGDHHLHAGRGQLMQRGDAAPARRAAGLAVLQVHVDHRQRDDGDAGLGEQRDDAAAIGVGGQRQRAAVAGDHAALEAVADHRAGDRLQRDARRANCFRRRGSRGRGRWRAAAWQT